MLTEGYCGICPKCGYDRMLVRYGTGGYFMYDACPSCSFAYGANDEREFSQPEVWNIIIDVFEPELKEKNLPITVGGIKTMLDSWAPPSRDITQVFDYSKDGKNNA